MTNIRPVSDLRNHFAELSQEVHESGEPVFLTKNGRGDMVLLSVETYARYQANPKAAVPNPTTGEAAAPVKKRPAPKSPAPKAPAQPKAAKSKK